MKRIVSIISLLLAGATFGLAAHAQTVYRIVGPDGRVTFSDKPPVSAEQGKVASTGVGANGAAANGSLPYELRQIAAKFPVMLYSGNNCAPCSMGRSLLTSRGIPFNERTVTTTEDSASLQRISGDTNLPFLTIGGQKISGFSDTEWNQYLDAAGYPQTSSLPPTYRNAPATPLVAVQSPAVAADNSPRTNAAPAPAPLAPPPPNRPSASNPAGIQF